MSVLFPRQTPGEYGLLESVAIHFHSLKARIRKLYEGETLGGVRFRYALLGLDIATVLFIVATSFLPRSKGIESLDIAFGVLILTDFSARLIISRQPLRDFTRLSTWCDIVAIISFLRRSPEKLPVSCGLFEHCDCCAITKWWPGFGSTAPSFGEMKM